MKRLAGVWLIALLTGAVVGTPFFVPVVGASGTSTGTTSAYTEFWDILNREAELVVGVETGNLSLAPDLVQNSRLGAENAANLSALTWQALEELKSSGVKTYYSAEELREMSLNISENGLPPETVNALKEQGWTDEQIRALEEYIVQNGENITEGFNMTSFLEDLSTSFVRVGFKYNHYESWALEKWKWTRPIEAPTTNSQDRLINPLMAVRWVSFYREYSHRDYENMENAIKSLRDYVYLLMLGNSSGENRMLLYSPGTDRLTSLTGKVTNVEQTENGGLTFTVTLTRITGTEEVVNTTTYYWPDALKAYELIGNVYTLVKARNYGNGNAEIDRMLNQKVAELKNALKVVRVSSEVTTRPIKDGSSSDSGSTKIADEIERLALDPQNSWGIFRVDDVEVEVTHKGTAYGMYKFAMYKVVVHYHVENNAVSNISVKFKGAYLEDSKSMAFLSPGEVGIITSGESEFISGSGEIQVMGVVKITYTSSPGPVPTNNSKGRKQGMEIIREYSATIKLEDAIDPNKISVGIPGEVEINEGDSVPFTAIVYNYNRKPVTGTCTLVATYPETGTQVGTVRLNKEIGVGASGYVIERIGNVSYSSPGTFGYSGKCDFGNGISKSFSGRVKVDSLTVRIAGVDVSSETPVSGDIVNFDVMIKNPFSVSKNVTVKLFIDGNEKSRENLWLGGGSSELVTLTWTAQAGGHGWRIEVLEDGKLWDSKSGTISVSRYSTHSFRLL